jgi:hypothetical protein
VLTPMVVSPRLKTLGFVRQRTFLGRSRVIRGIDSWGQTAWGEEISLTCGMRMICVSGFMERRRDEISCLKRDSIVGGPVCIVAVPF